MTAATVTEYCELGLPSLEMVSLEASDGETFKSRKFSTITGASISLNVASAAFTDKSASVHFSGDTATIELLGSITTDVPVTITLAGKH